MNKEELEIKEAELRNAILELELESQKIVNELDCKSIVQERIRRNIEVCNSVIKIGELCKKPDLVESAVFKITDHLAKLEA